MLERRQQRVERAALGEPVAVTTNGVLIGH